MWGKLTYDVSSLGWQPGEEYLILFYYRGNLEDTIRPRFAYSLGNSSQTRSIQTTGDPCPWSSMEVCADNSSRCCYHYEAGQTDTYPSHSFAHIANGSYNSGSYNGWELYKDSFVYQSEYTNMVNDDGDIRHNIGVKIGYNNTGAGTDFYIDDFVLARRIN